MTPEDIFIKDLKDYLCDWEVMDDKTCKRVRFLLNKYKQHFPPTKLIEKTVEKEVIVYRNQIKYINKNDIETSQEYCSIQTLIKEAKAFCDENKIDYYKFKKSNQRKAPTQIVLLRKKFCNQLRVKYIISVLTLARFFNIDHSTICYYLNGGHYKPRSKVFISQAS